MAERIEDYGLIGDLHAAALVGRTGSIDWLCFPRFDSDACFAALLGDAENGRWLLAPQAGGPSTRRHYRDGTLVLENEWDTPEGTVRVIDFMPERGQAPDIVRIVEGVSGRVPMSCDITLRFGYGRVVPWLRQVGDAIVGVVGPDSVTLRTPVSLDHQNRHLLARFEVSAGQRVPFVLTWRESHLPPPRPVDPEEALADTEHWWQEWAAQCTYDGEWRDAVVRSLLTLKALIYAPTGGIVAAPTASLPEVIGGVRNWDYRYCWLRDSTYTLQALLYSGFRKEATAWREWLLRAVAGQPEHIQIMYGPGGERYLAEREIDWLSGYEGSRPVRIGNGAVQQFQLDVYGEVLDALYLARQGGMTVQLDAWQMQHALLDYLEGQWDQPDAGMWEVRSDLRHFVHSKVLAWAAFDRAVKTVENMGLQGPVDRWRQTRDDIHREVCEKGYDADRSTFVRSYGSSALDAATLLIPQVGFLPADDPRVAGTVDAVARELMVDGFLLRYDTEAGGEDGLPGQESAFLACTFWLADDYHLIGRDEQARELFERLLQVRNDLGLLAEEYDAAGARQIGNFPQAFSHVPLVNTALALSRQARPRLAHGGERREG